MVAIMTVQVRQDLYISIISIVIFTLLNFIGGIINEFYNFSSYGLTKVLETVPLFFIFGSCHFVLSQWESRLRKSLRLPIMRMILWVLIALPLLADSSSAISIMASADLVYAVIPGFSFLLTNVALLLNKNDWYTLETDVFGVMIFGVSVYQYIVLEVSTLIGLKITDYQFVKRKSDL